MDEKQHSLANGAISLPLRLSTPLAILLLSGALWIVADGARNTFGQLRGEPVQLEPPRWWLWGELLWRAWQRVDLVSWLLWILIAGIAASHLVGLSDDVRKYVFGGAGSILLALAVSTVVLARPKALIPTRLRKDPNLIQAWLHRGHGPN